VRLSRISVSLYTPFLALIHSGKAASTKAVTLVIFRLLLPNLRKGTQKHYQMPTSIFARCSTYSISFLHIEYENLPFYSKISSPIPSFPFLLRMIFSLFMPHFPGATLIVMPCLAVSRIRLQGMKLV
jgi:hypothetical protein